MAVELELKTGVRKSAPGAWTPADFSNQYAWYRSDGPLWQDSGRTSAAENDADPVGAWDDKWNSRHVVQATADRRPLLKTAIVNGQPVVRADGSNDYLRFQLASSLAQPFTFLVVAARKSTAWNPILSGYDMNVSASRVESLFRNTSAPAHTILLAAPTQQSSTSTATTQDQFHSLIIVFNGASTEVWIDGTQQTVGNPGTDPMIVIAPFIYALNDVGTLYGQVDMAEVVILSKVTDSDDRSNWASYVSTRYGI